MSQINRVPWGLQYLLGSKNFGKNPAQLAESVAPVLDMSPHLAYETLATETDYQAGLTTEGEYAEIVVPDNEAWQLLVVAGNVQQAAYNELWFSSLSVRPQNRGGVFTFAEIAYMTKQSNSSNIGTDTIGDGCVALMPIPFIVGPGSSIRHTLLELSNVTAIDVRLSVLFNRFEV